MNGRTESWHINPLQDIFLEAEAARVANSEPSPTKKYLLKSVVESNEALASLANHVSGFAIISGGVLGLLCFAHLTRGQFFSSIVFLAPLAVAGGCWLGLRSRRLLHTWHASNVQRARRSIRAILLDQGLLLLALEPNPFDRLPSLKTANRFWSWTRGSLLGRTDESNQLRYRLADLTMSFTQCANDIAPKKELTPAQQRKVAAVITAAICLFFFVVFFPALEGLISTCMGCLWIAFGLHGTYRSLLIEPAARLEIATILLED